MIDIMKENLAKAQSSMKSARFPGNKKWTRNPDYMA